MIIVNRNGLEQTFDRTSLLKLIKRHKDMVPKAKYVDVDRLCKLIEKGLGARMDSIQYLQYIAETCATLSTESFDYALLAGRIEMFQLSKVTPSTFKSAMERVKSSLTSEFFRKATSFDYDSHIIDSNDYQYDIIGLRTLEKSYLLRDENGLVERPQYLLMRVAVFLTETPQEAIETYKVMSEGYYTHASPTLFHCGMKSHQLASCFLVQMEEDSINGIFNTLKTVALISKSAGGIGLSISNIRASGSSIHGTGGTSNGIVPMLRCFNNTARYVDQGGGKRKGSFAIFLEPWHADVEQFLELKLNHGVEEERARDLFYSLWIPDLFMQRVFDDGVWSLFCPTKVTGLQDSYGAEFKRIYTEAEANGLYHKQIKARDLWAKVLTAQIETGTPYLMYKNAANTKSNQQHLGCIRQSNLCAEIVEYTSKDEIAVCTLASIALPKFVINNKVDYNKLVEVASLVTRNLNHVVDKTSYPVKEAENSNRRHRPIGIGVQGLADVLNMLHVPYDSEEAKNINKSIFESIYYGAVRESINLASIHGPFQSYKGSPCSQGRLQFDMWGITPTKYDWDTVKTELVTYGMRNSLLTACMPTASSASILGNTESMEPRTSNLYVRRVLSGEFVIMNKYLEQTCRHLGIWNDTLVKKIIKDRGSVKNIKELPENIRNTFKTVWEISQKTIIDMSKDRGAFIDQSQSLNLYLGTPTMAKLNSMHFYAWKSGLKTGQYYLRTLPKVNAVAFTVDQRQGSPMQVVPEEEECLSCSS